MPRFIDYDYNQTVLLPVAFENQILPGTFEHSIHYLVDHQLDLSIFDNKYKNDDAGRPAYDPAILLKIVLLAYSRGITSSRRIAQLCEENVMFMAISADSRPHFTTIADFISGSSEQIAALFRQVLLICDQMGLIGKEMFAVDGCKMPSNASKEWSGTRANLAKKADKIDRAVRYLLNKHRDEDRQGPPDPSIRQREEQQTQKLLKASEKIKAFLDKNEARIGRSGKEVQANITDPDSAKMKTGHGVIQGYTGVVAVDAKHQVVVHAEAFGTGQEHGLLEPMLEQARENLATPDKTENVLTEAKVLADSGFHCQTSLDHLETQQIDAYVADHGFRARDPRFATAGRHKEQPAPGSQVKVPKSSKERYTVADFRVDLEKRTCVCPAGKAMWLRCARGQIGRQVFMQFQAHKADCAACQLRPRCVRSITQKSPRLVNFLLESLPRDPNIPARENALTRMRHKIDSTLGRYLYGMRLGIVEPVFGHLRENLGLDRFTLRGRTKVDGQWKLMALLHNLTKIHRYGMAT
jgi:transposase